MALYTYSREPTGLLQSLCEALSQEFIDAGLERSDHGYNLGVRQFLQTRVVSTERLNSGFRKEKPTLKYLNLDTAPRFDARDLCEKFKDVVWGKGVQLDRVCISELSAEKVVEDGRVIGQRFHDIASFPLPGITWEPRSFEPLRIPHRWATAETQGRDRA